MIPSPSALQLRWQQAGFGLFCHFGINTFHGWEWSDGSLDPALFNPVKFDPAQWVSIAQQAGMKYLVLTAKHHDGFCLWPTSTTGYSVSSSPYRGDIVGEVAKACADAGMHLGLYLSPWDRNAACYSDKEAYDRFYCEQLTELCTRYGPLFELWFDGAGSEGRVYDWDAIMDVVDRHQPGAVVFNMGRPTIRWAGNEDGLAQDPCYYAVDNTKVSAFTDREDTISAEKIYLPPECDVSIRQHWFGQIDDLETLKTTEHLLGIYYRSVGLGANLLLNLGPNRDGLLDANDASRLLEMRRELDARFKEPKGAAISSIAGGFAIDFGEPRSFDHLELREDVTAGQAIDGYRVIDDDSGREICSGVTIGVLKWNAFPKATARRLRIECQTFPSSRAVLESAAAYLTGHEKFPELGKPLDYAACKAKAMMP